MCNAYMLHRRNPRQQSSRKCEQRLFIKGSADISVKAELFPNPKLPYVPFPKTDLPENAPASHQFISPPLPFTIFLFLLYKKESILLTYPKPCYGVLSPGCTSLQSIAKG